METFVRTASDLMGKIKRTTLLGKRSPLLICRIVQRNSFFFRVVYRGGDLHYSHVVSRNLGFGQNL